MASSTTEVTKEGDGVRVNTQSTVKSSNFVFPFGKAVEYTTMDGRKTMVSLSAPTQKVVFCFNNLQYIMIIHGSSSVLKATLINV